MSYIYFNRYFCSTPTDVCGTISEDYSFSNMMYDQHKGISHALLPYPGNRAGTRYVGDVEICMSSDPNITSRFSAVHRDMVKKQLSAQPHTPDSGLPSPTDDQLIQNGPIRSLERDELVMCSKANMARLDSELPHLSPPSVSPIPSPSSVESSKSDKSE